LDTELSAKNKIPAIYTQKYTHIRARAHTHTHMHAPVHEYKDVIVLEDQVG
jgi:hypothetical protein